MENKLTSNVALHSLSAMAFHIGASVMVSFTMRSQEAVLVMRKSNNNVYCLHSTTSEIVKLELGIGTVFVKFNGIKMAGLV